MKPPTDPMVAPTVDDTGHIAIVYCNEAFTFDPGHRMRAARCLVCREMIGGQSATVIGAAALAGEACPCGGLVSDVFLAHADHFPMPPAELQAAIRHGLECGTN
ncbi:MAG: hypothetical protein ACRD45_22830 [Bryobacteraceae bacterium]